MIAEGIYPDYDKAFPQTFKDGSIFGANVAVGEGTIIALLVSVGENVTLGKNCRVEAGVFIGSGTQIGDGVKIGSDCLMRRELRRHFKFKREDCRGRSRGIDCQRAG